MRKVSKIGTGGFHLTQSNLLPPATGAEATGRWHSFAHKAALQQCLLDEQYHLCCYSEMRSDQEGLGFHIEHVENKRQNPARTFDYTNLAASALDSASDLEAFKAQDHEVFGGHAAGKQGSVDVARFVSCHQHDCPDYFAYLSDGRVVPAAGLNEQKLEKALYTITLLNLNSPFLLTRRRQWWDELDELYDEHLAKGWDLSDLISIDLVPMNHTLSRFFSLTRQFFGPVAESTLRQRAPNLL